MHSGKRCRELQRVALAPTCSSIRCPSSYMLLLCTNSGRGEGGQPSAGLGCWYFPLFCLRSSLTFGLSSSTALCFFLKAVLPARPSLIEHYAFYLLANSTLRTPAGSGNHLVSADSKAVPNLRSALALQTGKDIAPSVAGPSRNSKDKAPSHLRTLTCIRAVST